MNVILIGMPGSGKSTVGFHLAQEVSYTFLDTDRLIEEQHGCPLQEIVDQKGQAAFLEIEEQALLSLKDLDRHVVSTGGSAVYSDRAMRHLREMGRVVFLDVPFERLENRIKDFHDRGIARRPCQTLHDLYLERYPLYREYADLTINSPHLTVREICHEIARLLAINPHFATTPAPSK